MNSSLYVVGVKAPDEKWKKMKAIYDSCKAAGVDPPRDVEKFFNNDEPDEKGVLVPLAMAYDRGGNHECISRYKKEMYDGFIVDLSKLPKDLTHLQFFISY